jgi:hypothetical protein
VSERPPYLLLAYLCNKDAALLCDGKGIDGDSGVINDLGG